MRKIVPVLAFFTGATLVFGGVETLKQRSPFLPPAAPQAADANNALSRIELTGIFSLDGKPRFSVRDAATGRSLWIALGETQEGLKVKSYDDKTASVIVEGRGTSRRIVIREATVKTAGPPPPVPMPSVGSSNAPVQVAQQPQPVITPKLAPGKPKPAPRDPKIVQQERDARLLVSDLMEISIQERKRYEENQRRVAAGLPRLAPNEPLPDNK